MMYGMALEKCLPGMCGLIPQSGMVCENMDKKVCEKDPS